MITKKQALEFIDELFNQTNVYINLKRGKMYADVYADYEKGITGTCTADIGFKPQSYELPLLEELVTEFIRVNQDSNLFNYFDKIPVDIGMLEVGQTYKVIFNDVQITDELTKIDDNNVYFKRFYPIKIPSIKEIYKVNE